MGNAIFTIIYYIEILFNFDELTTVYNESTGKNKHISFTAYQANMFLK